MDPKGLTFAGLHHMVFMDGRISNDVTKMKTPKCVFLLVPFTIVLCIVFLSNVNIKQQ